MHFFNSGGRNPATQRSSFKICLPALGLFAALALGAAPRAARACACGCGIFDVGTSSMLPGASGETFFLEDDFQDQTRNWSGSSPAPAMDNPDKEIRTDFVTAGFQDMFNRNWGVEAQLPYAERYFRTTGGATGDQIVSFDWRGFSDLRLQGIYTGFSPDMSGGVTFGLKLPTGDYTQNDAYGDIDRDSEVGTGSTDILLGVYQRGSLARASSWSWFAQGLLDLPVLERDSYRPGDELDAAVGIYPRGWLAGRLRITPMVQAKFSARGEDTGINAASPVASGYRRLLLAPGIEFDAHPVMVYADVELPVYQHFTGDQLSAPALFKMSVAYMF
jgi:hypothetical protein